MLYITSYESLNLLAELYISTCLLSCAHILVDQCKRPIPKMKVMLWVWPITTLWSGIFGIWAYRVISHRNILNTDEDIISIAVKKEKTIPNLEMQQQNNTSLDKDSMQGMDMNMSTMKHTFNWKQITKGTLHCGSGCTIADIIGPLLFRLLPFTLFGTMLYGEWALEYLLALIIGVFFQYAALASMTTKHGLPLWWKAFKVDFLSLTAWQIGMYGWMAIAVVLLIGPMSPTEPIFWFMMQLGMFCGFITSYPMNWWLMSMGIKKVM